MSNADYIIKFWQLKVELKSTFSLKRDSTYFANVENRYLFVHSEGFMEMCVTNMFGRLIIVKNLQKQLNMRTNLQFTAFVHW